MAVFIEKPPVTKYEKQDQQGKAAFNERTPPPWPSNKNQWQGAQADPKHKKDSSKCYKSYKVFFSVVYTLP
jgi:hypothetical protein